jgi:hypothetical protein
MEVGQAPNWGCNAKKKKRRLELHMRFFGYQVNMRVQYDYNQSPNGRLIQE